MDGPKIWLDATVVDFIIDREEGRIAGFIARSKKGRVASLRARHLVLSAGAIESTRLLLYLNAKRQLPSSMSRALGRYFHDHISAQVADIQPTNLRLLNRIAGYSFEGQTMRSFRYEITPAARRNYGLASGFCHIAFDPPHHSGIDDLRQFMRSIQSGEPDMVALVRSGLDTTYLARALYWRLVRRQLYWPRASRLSVHVVIEQMPEPTNALSLSTLTDQFGVPRASLSWSIKEFDVASLKRIRREFHAFWCESRLRSCGTLHWDADHDEAERLSDPNDIFHPGGTTRMGADFGGFCCRQKFDALGLPQCISCIDIDFPHRSGRKSHNDVAAIHHATSGLFVSANVGAPAYGLERDLAGFLGNPAGRYALL